MLEDLGVSISFKVLNLGLGQFPLGIEAITGLPQN